MNEHDLMAVRTLFAGHSDMRELPLDARRAAVMLGLELTPVAGAVSGLLLTVQHSAANGLVVFDPEAPPAVQRAAISRAVAEYIAHACGFEGEASVTALADLFG
jgi:hypothetical protein